MSQQSLLDVLGIDFPIIQAPMAGVATVPLAAAVSNAGGLGSLALGNASVASARAQIRALKAATQRSFNVNFFCHQPAVRDSQQEQRWIEDLTPYFAEFSAQPPTALSCEYETLIANPELLAMLLEERPPVVSFHFGLPEQATIDALKQAGIRLLACATSLAEAQAIERAGLDGIVAQGYEAGGHRGAFDADKDLQLGLSSLLQLLKQHCQLPVIAAGGIMHGAAIASVLRLGASAAQMGTAFILCPESAANSSYRTNLKSSNAYQTQVTPVISGRPARGLVNRFYTELAQLASDLPAYPIAYSAAKALNAAASAQGSSDFAVHWAGQSAPLAREMPAAQLVACLQQELKQAQQG